MAEESFKQRVENLFEAIGEYIPVIWLDRDQDELIGQLTKTCDELCEKFEGEPGVNTEAHKWRDMKYSRNKNWSEAVDEAHEGREGRSYETEHAFGIKGAEIGGTADAFNDSCKQLTPEQDVTLRSITELLKCVFKEGVELTVTEPQKLKELTEVQSAALKGFLEEFKRQDPEVGTELQTEQSAGVIDPVMPRP